MHFSTLTDSDDTIAAVASAAGTAERGIIRVSGVDALGLLKRFLIGATPVDGTVALDEKVARRYPFLVPLGGLGVRFPMDVMLWPGTRSYTGQPTVELHTLGVPSLLEQILSRLFELGARPAQPGEFTMRSFLAGRISLVQAEAVLGVIDARTDEQLDVALKQLAGGISSRMREMRDQLLDDLADLEAGLDFVEEDIEFVDRAEFGERLRRLYQELDGLCESALSRMHQSSALQVVLAGLPNAGKSSLFNCLTGEQALVSEIQGTTTDYLLGTLKIGEQEISLFDTAGWEDGQTGISELAQQLRAAESQRADLILWCTAADMGAEESEQDEILWQKLQSGTLPCWRVLTKSEGAFLAHEELGRFSCLVSSQAGTGISSLKQALGRFLEEHQAAPWELLGSTAARCRDALLRTRDHLKSALRLAEQGLGDEFLAEELRGAIQELGIILGHVYTDDLLDRVFSKFCIGK